MSSRAIIYLAAIASVVAVPSVASAQTFLQRCEIDSLAPEPAIERVEWYVARYPAEVLAKGQSVTGRTLTQAQAETWYRKMHLEDSIFGGPAERPLYPTFLLSDLTNPNNYFAPTVRAAPANKPANYVWPGSCLSSCYKPGTDVLFAVQDEAASAGVRYQNVAIDVALEWSLPRIAVLSDSSTLEAPVLRAADVAFYTRSIVPVEHEILNFTTESGGTLQITPSHPVVDGTGAMREARTLVVGESLVRVDGSPDAIVSITAEKFTGRVYNVASQVPSLLGNIVIANGFLNGSAWYQNQGTRYFNRVLLRDAIPESALE